MTSSTHHRPPHASGSIRRWRLFDTDQHAAQARFREATEIDPSMADAWLGRIAAGDDALSTLQQLYAYGARLHRETNRLGARLSASIKAGPYLAISVTESSHAGLALASALIDDGQYEKAEALLKDSALLDTWENHQWQQYVRAYLMFATQRWPDVISVAATILPPQAIIMSAVTAATNALAAHAAAHLGQARVALDWADRVDCGPADGRGASPPPDRHRGDGDRPERIPVDRSRSRLCARDGASPARRGGQGPDLAVQGHDQRRADRAGQAGAGRPAAATGGHRRGHHQHPQQQVGRHHRAVGSRSAAKRRTKSGATSCWPRVARC